MSDMGDQLEDADRRGVNPYAEIQARGRANDPGPGALFRAGDDTRMRWADRPVDDGPDEFPPPRFSPFPKPAPLPEQPAPGSVVGFVKDFGNGKLYHYVAINVEGLGWYLTGPRSNRDRLTWDALLAFVGGPNDWPTMGIVSAWDRLVQP